MIAFIYFFFLQAVFNCRIVLTFFKVLTLEMGFFFVFSFVQPLVFQFVHKWNGFCAYTIHTVSCSPVTELD